MSHLPRLTSDAHALRLTVPGTAKSYPGVVPPTDLLPTAGQREALARLVKTVLEGVPFIALTGGAGLGKTLLLDRALTELARQPIRVVRVDGARSGRLGLNVLVGELAGTAPGRRAERSMEDVFEALHATSDGKTRTVLAIDAAERLARATLNYLLLLSTLLGPRASLQVILVGRPDFWTLLEGEGFRRLRERIAERLTLDPLSEEQAQAHLGQLLLWRGSCPITRPAAAMLLRLAEGRPDRMDVILHRAISLAEAERKVRINAGMVQRAAASLVADAVAERPRKPRSPVTWLLRAGLAPLLLVAVSGAAWGWGWSEFPPP